MRKIILSLFLILLCYLNTSCAKEPAPERENHFPADTAFHIGIDTSEVKTKAKVFFDQKGALHLLHEDTSSPLFGLEEIFTEGGVKSHFHEMEFESLPYPGGISTVYRVFKTIQEESPEERDRDQNSVIYRYENDSLQFYFLFQEENCAPLRIYGSEDGKEFDINFIAAA